MRLVLAIVLFAAPALAQSDLDELAKWANGTWRCRATAGNDAYTFTLKFSWDLDRKWLQARLDGKVQKGRERVRSVSLYGWDGAQITSLFLNNQGARGVSSSPGWNGDTLAFGGSVTMDGYTTQTTSSLTRKGKRELSLSSRTGSFVADTTCRK